MKEKLGKVLPCCFPGNKGAQDELDVILAPFQNYCRLESSEQKVQLNMIKEKLSEVLSNDKAKHEVAYKENQRQFIKKWRNRRIKIYDYLLHLALYNPNESLDLWIEGKKCTSHFYIEASYKLKPERFYTYLVDQVHEDEEIMFKFYCLNNGEEKPFEWRKNALWLVGSIMFYCKFVWNQAFKALKTWDDEKQPLCNNLVKEAKEKFVDKFSKLHGRCFKKGRNWRNRARFYYLLGLIRHTGISNKKIGKFKNFDYEGPFSHLVREMIVEDKDLFDQESKDNLLLICKTKYAKRSNGPILGHLKLNRLLAWASAANDLGFVKVILEYYLDNVKSSPDRDFKWEKFMGESWAMALWNASYKGHAQIIKELLSWEISYHSYYSEYFSDKTITPPLQIAVLRKDISVVDAFCTTASLHLNCNEKNPNGYTPLEIATKLRITNDKTKTIKRKIQNCLLQRQEVKDAVAEARIERQLAVDSSNAIMVGGTLIASITYAGWLSPPLGYNLYYQFVETTIAAPPNSYESYMSIQGHPTIQFFAIFNSLSFYFAIGSIVAGMETFRATKVVEDTYAIKTVKKLQRKLTWATNLFLASIVCVLVAFSCAGIAVLPPIKKYQKNMYITMSIGGFFCILFICKMVWYTLPKNFRNKVKLKRHPIFDNI